MLNVLIRTDGNAQMGLGHVTRCVALAQMLGKCFNVTFYLRESDAPLHAMVHSHGFGSVSINQEIDFLNCLTGEEIVVLDGYKFNTDFQKKIKEAGCLLICVDDLHDKHFVSDVVINHAPGVTASVYSGELYTKFLLGPKYSLLRPAFLKLARRRREINVVNSVLICFGGSDYMNLTVPVLKTVLQYAFIKKITVVTGGAYPYETELSELVTTYSSKIRHFAAITADEMAECMATNDFVIVPSSGILLEALAAKCLVISGYYADNQKDLYYGALHDRVIIGCGNFSEPELRKALQSIPKERKDMLEFGVIDGESGNRIKSIFLHIYFQKNISLRIAGVSDCLQYFEWANDELVRRNSVNQESFSWKDHENWFIKRLNSEHIKFYMFFLRNVPVGQVRFELQKDTWIIDYSVDKRMRGSGIGQYILNKSIEELRNVSRVKISAIIKENNLPSIKIFEKLNFTFDGTKSGFIHFSLS